MTSTWVFASLLMCLFEDSAGPIISWASLVSAAVLQICCSKNMLLEDPNLIWVWSFTDFSEGKFVARTLYLWRTQTLIQVAIIATKIQRFSKLLDNCFISFHSVHFQILLFKSYMVNILSLSFQPNFSIWRIFMPSVCFQTLLQHCLWCRW